METIGNIINNVDATRCRWVYKLYLLNELKEQRNQVSIVPKFAEKNFNNIKGPVEKKELGKKEKIRRGLRGTSMDGRAEGLYGISKGGQCALQPRTPSPFAARDGTRPLNQPLSALSCPSRPSFPRPTTPSPSLAPTLQNATWLFEKAPRHKMSFHPSIVAFSSMFL